MLHLLVHCGLDGTQLEGQALLLQLHSEQQDCRWWIILAGVRVGGRIGPRVLLLGGGSCNNIYTLRWESQVN